MQGRKGPAESQSLQVPKGKTSFTGHHHFPAFPQFWRFEFYACQRRPFPIATFPVRNMAGSKVAYAALKGPNVVREIVIGITLGLAAGSLWKMHHWNEQRKVRAFYDMLEKGQISVVAHE